MKLLGRLLLVVSAGLVAVLAALVPTACTVIGPDSKYAQPLPLLSAPQRSLADQLRADVQTLAGDIGERNLSTPGSLKRAEDFLAASLAHAGYPVRWQTYTCQGPGVQGQAVSNLEVELRGTSHPEEIVVIGAHYDSVHHNEVRSPGADDNASGTAAVLALARAFIHRPQARTVRFVLFANEEPPYFYTDDMGSLVYARTAHQRNDRIVSMLSLETLGYYTDAKASQNYPALTGAGRPDTGNFVCFVGPSDAGDFMLRCVRTFRAHADIPAEGGAYIPLVPRLMASDHWSFWKQGLHQAVMVTDTAPYRYPFYHLPGDTPDKLNYEHLARVVQGLDALVVDLATPNRDD